MNKLFGVCIIVMSVSATVMLITFLCSLPWSDGTPTEYILFGSIGMFFLAALVLFAGWGIELMNE